MIIGELQDPITASKADWLSGSTWLGFTPSSGHPQSRAKCQSTIQRQFGRGYVIEYITKKFDRPNAGFDSGLEYKEEREKHDAQAGRLIAVHRLQASSLPLEQILGAEEYDRLQDKWAQPGKRHRWSVAFPIVESYDIDGWPEADQVLGSDLYKKLYRYSTGVLRPVPEAAQRAFSSLRITPRATANYWIGLAKEAEIAARSPIHRRLLVALSNDLALEGETEERKAMIRRRAAHLASKFVKDRQQRGMLSCDHCRFDPATLSPVPPSLRGLLDVHHRNPLAEGVRLTTFADLAMLCPICHRHEHQLLKRGRTLLA